MVVLLHENLAGAGCAVAEALTDDVDALASLRELHAVDGEYLSSNHFGSCTHVDDAVVDGRVVSLGEFAVVEEENVIHLSLGAATCLCYANKYFVRTFVCCTVLLPVALSGSKSEFTDGFPVFAVSGCLDFEDASTASVTVADIYNYVEWTSELLCGLYGCRVRLS